MDTFGLALLSAGPSCEGLRDVSVEDLVKAGCIVNKDIEQTPRGMGVLENAVYKDEWRKSYAYHHRISVLAASKKFAEGRDTVSQYCADEALSRNDQIPKPTDNAEAALPNHSRLPRRSDERPRTGKIAARLLLARTFDRDPSLLARFWSQAGVLLLDVPDAECYRRIESIWQETLRLENVRTIELDDLSDKTQREKFDAIVASYGDPLTARNRENADRLAFVAIQLALPILAITPSADSHLSKILIDAASDRVVIPPVDNDTIEKVIRIVSARRCSTSFSEKETAQVSMRELLLAVRFDRTPLECISRLQSLIAGKFVQSTGGRSLTIDQLHGLDKAVAWAKGVKIDLEAWRRGEIGWDALDAGVVLDGPPGTGKTLFAKVLSEYLDLPMVAATYAKWQGSGDGHLGHMLRAMKQDFDDARSKGTPCILFIDEIDSFPDRRKVSHSHRDYVVSVVNGLIEQCDGIQGRDRVILVGSSNDVSRCDPAITRSGRFNRIIRISLPGPSEIEKMLRVRLNRDLIDVDVSNISLLLYGATGADIERYVKDARRQARQQGRDLTYSDLKDVVLGGGSEMTPAMRERAAIHEAGHIMLQVIHYGPNDLQAVVAAGQETAGMVLSKVRTDEEGTLDQVRAMLQTILAGRAAEEVALGAPGSGSGIDAVGSDLAHATRLGAAMVGCLGLAGPHPLLFLADFSQTELVMQSAHLRTAVHEELSTAYVEAKRHLTLNYDALEEVARTLNRNGRIDGDDVALVIAKHRRTLGGEIQC